MNGISALIRRDMRDDLSLPYEDTMRRKLVYNPESMSSPHIGTAGGLMWGLPASRTVRTK